MPISKYDRYFGGDARKAYAAMISKYGRTRGRRVFYATVNKKRGAA